MTQDELVAFLEYLPARTGKLATVRADGRPHVAPIWFALDTSTAGADSPIGDVLFNTGADTLKGKSLIRDGRVALCVDDDRPPFAFATLEGVASMQRGMMGRCLPPPLERASMSESRPTRTKRS
jgi:PPOX class probable F420-dependent enzyme